MNLSQMACFLEIVKTGSFTRAAEHLFLTQQGVSRQMQSLEKYLGFPLFIRSKKGLVLTKEGVLLAEQWGACFNTIQTSIDKARDTYYSREQRLKIALEDMGSLTEQVVASFSEFEKREQQLSLEFQILPPSAIRPLFTSGEVDYAVVYERELQDLKNLQHISVNSRPLQLVGVMAASHPFAGREVDMQRFFRCPFGILSTEASTHYRDIVMGVFGHYHITPAEPFMEFRSRHELEVAVAANRCVTILYETGFGEEQDRLHFIPLSCSEFTSKVGLFWNNEENTIKARMLAEVIREFLDQCIAGF